MVVCKAISELKHFIRDRYWKWHVLMALFKECPKDHSLVGCVTISGTTNYIQHGKPQPDCHLSAYISKIYFHSYGANSILTG